MHQFGIACVPCASNVLAHYVKDIREMGKTPETPNPKPEREMGKREKTPRNQRGKWEKKKRTGREKGKENPTE